MQRNYLIVNLRPDVYRVVFKYWDKFKYGHEIGNILNQKFIQGPSTCVTY